MCLGITSSKIIVMTLNKYLLNYIKMGLITHFSQKMAWSSVLIRFIPVVKFIMLFYDYDFLEN